MREQKGMRSAIALMITLFFVMALSVSIGLGLKYVKEGKESVNEEAFLLQTRSIVSDFLVMLGSAPQIKSIHSTDTLALFLSEASLLPFSSNDVDVIIKIGSARGKVSPKIFNTKEKRSAFLAFLATKGVNRDYLDIFDDLMGGIKEDGSYKSDIFTSRDTLFRDGIVSAKQIEIADGFYNEKFQDESLKNIVPTELFYTNAENNATHIYKMDLNYVKPIVWELLLGCSKERAEALYENAGAYAGFSDLGLSSDENLSLMRFHQNISYYEPYISVEITIMKENEKALISFEYNLESKKGSNFVLEV